MQSVSQKIRTGLLELRTPSGFLYASPTFWQRLYLLWTFRHFRSLSRRVLSQRQQELVDQLSQTAMALEHGKVARASVIGAVEDIAKISPRPVALPAADKLLQMPAASARLTVASAVGSELASLPQKPVEKKLYRMIESQPVARVSRFSARTADKPKRADFSGISVPATLKFPPRRWLEWASGAALSVALLGMVFYVTEMRPSSISATSRQAALATSESHSSPTAPPTASSVPAVSEQAVTPELAPTAPLRAAANSRPDPIRSGKPRVELPSPPPVESSSVPRVHVSGAPAQNFIYPDAPNSTLTGTVNLRALIGPDGLVKHVDVLSGKPALARPAVDAMRHWRYSPPQSDGQAAEAETRVIMNFVGDDAVTIVFPTGNN